MTALALLGWIGGEMHYRNCLAHADARYPVNLTEAPLGPGKGIGGYSLGNKYLGEDGGNETFEERKRRLAAIADCSRRPWS